MIFKKLPVDWRSMKIKPSKNESWCEKSYLQYLLRQVVVMRFFKPASVNAPNDFLDKDDLPKNSRAWLCKAFENLKRTVYGCQTETPEMSRSNTTGGNFW